MDYTKHPLLSRGVIGSLVGILLVIAQSLKIEALVGVEPGALTDVIYNIATGVAFLVALWGRVAATKQIKV